MEPREENFFDEPETGPEPYHRPLSPEELTEAFRHHVIVKGGRTRIERFDDETGKWEMLPESWKQFKRGSSSYKKRLEDFHQLVLLLNSERAN